MTIHRETRLYIDRLLSMSSCEWHLREQSSISGFTWTLLQPALMFGTLFLVFTHWLKVSDASFTPRLLIGVVMYGFFHNATTYGLTSINRRASMVMSFVFPRELVVLAACLSTAASHIFELFLMSCFLLIFGATLSWSWLLLPVLFLASLAIVLGLSLALAPAAALHPDLERAWSVLLTAGFYLTPVFYRPNSLSSQHTALLQWNPLTHLLEAARACLLEGRIEWRSTAVLLALGAASLALGLRGFRSREARLGDYLSRSV